MPQEQAQYRKAYKARKEELLPQSDGKTITPEYLLSHENHFDPNIFTPEQLIQKGITKPGGIKTESKA